MPAPTNPGLGNLDPAQIFQRSFDESMDRLRVDAAVHASIPPSEIAVEIDAATGDNIAIADPVSGLMANVETVGGKASLDVQVMGGSITGAFTPSGLRIALKNTTMDVTDVATPLPAVAIANRNAITIRNLSLVDTVYIGNLNVTADRILGNTSGGELGPNESWNVDITDSIVLYGRTEAGKTARIKIMELS